MSDTKAHPQRMCDGDHWSSRPHATFLRRVSGDLFAFCTEECWRAFVLAEFGVRAEARRQVSK